MTASGGEHITIAAISQATTAKATSETNQTIANSPGEQQHEQPRTHHNHGYNNEQAVRARLQGPTPTHMNTVFPHRVVHNSTVGPAEPPVLTFQSVPQLRDVEPENAQLLRESEQVGFDEVDATSIRALEHALLVRRGVDDREMAHRLRLQALNGRQHLALDLAPLGGRVDELALHGGHDELPGPRVDEG
eukprot:15485871-Alexandrium_andersonii.AAC.2